MKMVNLNILTFSYSNPYDSLIRPVNAVLNAYANGKLSGEKTK